jgi:ATP-binding cassette subfamily B protein
MAMQQSVVSLISSSLLFGGIVAMMLFLSPPLFLVSAAVLGLTALAFKVTGGRSRLYYRRQQQALGALNGNIQEMIDGLKVVKAFGHEEEAKRDFDALNGDYRAAATEAGFYSTAIMPISNNLMNIGYALTAMFGGLLSALSGFDLGGLWSI